MRIEMVSVCVGYGDFLAHTLPLNMIHADRFLVVTTDDDEETREVCRKNCIETLITEEFTREERPFAKSRGILRGLELLSRKDWVLHIDSDIVLPFQFKDLLEKSWLQDNTLYGADRVMIKSYEKWLDYRQKNLYTHDWGFRVNLPDGYNIGSRFVHEVHGYCPVGYFQLWHGKQDAYKGVNFKRYPYHGNTAARDDVQFALRWDRKYRQLLPEVVVTHLESEPAKLGANWNGRTTKRFGPDPEIKPKPPSPRPDPLVSHKEEPKQDKSPRHQFYSSTTKSGIQDTKAVS